MLGMEVSNMARHSSELGSTVGSGRHHDDLLSEVGDDEVYGLAQVRVVGNDDGHVPPLFPRVVEQVHAGVHVGAFLLERVNLGSPGTIRGRPDQWPSNRLGRETPEVDFVLRELTKSVEVDLLASRGLRIALAGHAGREMADLFDDVRTRQEGCRGPHSVCRRTHRASPASKQRDRLPNWLRRPLQDERKAVSVRRVRGRLLVFRDPGRRGQRSGAAATMRSVGRGDAGQAGGGSPVVGGSPTTGCVRLTPD